MDISEILTQEAIIPNLKVTSKKQLLKELSKVASDLIAKNPPSDSRHLVSERIVYDILVERERLGTTGVGNGIAIPHGKLPKLKRLQGLFARLDQPVDFESIDDQPVDLVFLLIVPDGAGADHLKALAHVSRLLRDRVICEKIRGAKSAEAIYSILSSVSS